MKFVYLLAAFLLVFSSHGQTRKRYKQRNHKLQANVDVGVNPEVKGTLNLSYARNWGYFELGGFAEALIDDLEFSRFDMDNLGLKIGLSFEGNFIKNKRRNNWIPSGGLKVSWMPMSDVFISPYLVSKFFISSRTSLNLELAWPIQVMDRFKLWSDDGVQLLFGYAYYFH